MRIAYAMIVLGLAVPASMQGAERKVPCDTLPAAVMEKANEMQKDAVLRSCVKDSDAKGTLYELEMVKGSRGHDVTFDAMGNVVEVEDEIDAAALPVAVSDSLKKAAAGGKVTSVESLSRKGTIVQYEAVVMKNGRRSEVAFHPDGTRAHED